MKNITRQTFRTVRHFTENMILVNSLSALSLSSQGSGDLRPAGLIPTPWNKGQTKTMSLFDQIPTSDSPPTNQSSTPEQAAELAQPKVIFSQVSDKPSLQGRPVRILHASDWHLGRSLNRIRRRHQEQTQFLDWLVEILQEQKIEVLLVAGDIFDSANPSLASQELYYNFLHKVSQSGLQDVVIIGGNHDSAAFLSAPAKLLEFFHIHVVAAPENLAEELLVLNDANNQPYLVVAATPFLRDRYLRTAQEGETIQDKDRRLIEGLMEHYAAIAQLAQEKQTQLGGSIPIVGLGHLFTGRGQVTTDDDDNDGVRALYVGSLCQAPAEKFSEAFDYLALGHLHHPQKAGRETIRYSGSPMMMSFSEKSAKSLPIVTLGGGKIEIELYPIPVFQELIQLKGTKNELFEAINRLKKAGSKAWLKVVHNGDEVLANPRDVFEEVLKGGNMELITIIDERAKQQFLSQVRPVKDLAEMTVHEVFALLLDRKDIKEPDRWELISAYQEIVLALAEEGQAID
ncbi:MAG: exonuclease SbcCD subunit D C-terminal domain-containing protein [Deltaproteobacteria bacterium]|nr:exonuclease SbcCD subunit D C-terminal domain-containing protein [Deltaproteobacteria bacterium]